MAESAAPVIVVRCSGRCGEKQVVEVRTAAQANESVTAQYRSKVSPEVQLSRPKRQLTSAGELVRADTIGIPDAFTSACVR